MTACALDRDEGEADIDFMVRCKVAMTNTCAESVVVEVVEEEVETETDDQPVDIFEDDDAGEGW